MLVPSSGNGFVCDLTRGPDARDRSPRSRPRWPTRPGTGCASACARAVRSCPLRAGGRPFPPNVPAATPRHPRRLP